MKRIVNYGIRIFFIGAIIYFVGVINIKAQTLDGEAFLNGQLEMLKRKYPWGNIYLSYSSIAQVKAILNDTTKFQMLVNQHSAAVILRLRTELNNCVDPGGISRSAAVIEINLNVPGVGLVRANSITGRIDSFNLDRWWTIRIAMICDAVLTTAYGVQNFLNQINNIKNAVVFSIEDLIGEYQKLSNDPYTSSETANTLLVGLRTLIENKPAEVEKISQTNKELYSSLMSFKNYFDSVLPKDELSRFKKNKVFSDDLLQKFNEQTGTQKISLCQTAENSCTSLQKVKIDEPIFEPYLYPSKENQAVTLAGKELPEKDSYYNRGYNSRRTYREPWNTDLLKGYVFSGKLNERIAADKYFLTVVKTETAKQISESVKSGEGKTFLLVEILIESISDEGFEINPASARVKDSAGYEYYSLSGGKEPLLKRQVNLAKGEKVRGWISFEIPENAKEMTLVFQSMSQYPTRVNVKIN